MTALLCKSDEAVEYPVVNGDTLESIALANCSGLGWKVLARYNWGTDRSTEVRRALCETVGVDLVDLLDNSLKATPEKLKLKPYASLSPTLKIPKAWKLDSAEILKTHTVEVKRKRAATAVAITGLTYFFDPSKAGCPVDCEYEGDAARATQRDFEVHATGYYRVKTKVLPGGTAYPEIPCGTVSKTDLTQTHICCRNAGAAPGVETIPWDGGSEATVGVLTNPAKINSQCAPYNVLIRYYKDAADKAVRLKLDPFYPRWRLTGLATYTLEEDSLVVKWTIEGQESSKEKLTRGQLLVWDMDGLVFIAPLTKDQISGGTYDLLNGPVKWDKSKIERKKLPYRIQIQAHSDADEDNGLALAVMPTQVPPYFYQQVQFIGFNIQNDTAGTDYRGHDTPKDDIEKRCSVMIDAVQRSHASANANSKILKVFVAPEFYFRGTNGTYPVEEISTIVPRLREESDKPKYVDWLFVFGTAIGTQKHELDGGQVTYCEKKLPVDLQTVVDATTIRAKLWTAPRSGWVIEQNTTKRTILSSTELSKDRTDTSAIWQINVGDTTGLNIGNAEMVQAIVDVQPGTPCRVKLNSPDCSRIPVNSMTNKAIIIGGEWQLVSGAILGDIQEVERQSDGSYWLKVDQIGGDYQVGQPFELLEPFTTEITNVALVQKGWHAPLLGDKSLRQVVTYKEFISPIDFRQNVGNTFHDATGVKRKVRIYKTDDEPILPTAGSIDIGGASPNITRQPNSSVGSEINLTGQGGGCVFMMDGITFGLEVCLDHAEHRLWNFYAGTNKQAGDPKVQVQLIPSYGMSVGLGKVPGREVTALPNGLVFNVDGQRMESVARLWDQTYSCDTHWDKVGVMNGTCNGEQYALESGEKVYNCHHPSHVPNLPWRTIGACWTHGAYVCTKPFQKLGTGFAASSKIQVPSSNNTTYFNREGNVQVFPPKNLPDPDIV